VAEAIEADCRIPLGRKEEDIHGGTTAVATVDIGHHALSPRDQLVVAARLIEGCQLVGKLIAHRAEHQVGVL